MYQKEKNSRLAYKINESAALLGVSPKSIRRAIKRGLITPCRAFRHPLIPVAELERFLSATSIGNGGGK